MPPTSQSLPRSPKIASSPSSAGHAGPHAGAVGKELHAAHDAVALAADVVEEELAADRPRRDRDAGVAVGRVRQAADPDRAVRVEQDRAARVVLVVERELARAARAVEVPAVDVVGVPAQHVARVDRMAVVGAHQADHGAGRVVPGRVRVDERLGAGHRVVARAAVQRVVAEPAEDDVVIAARRAEQRILERIDVERGQVDRLLQLARDVDRRRSGSCPACR